MCPGQIFMTISSWPEIQISRLAKNTCSLEQFRVFSASISVKNGSKRKLIFLEKHNQIIKQFRTSFHKVITSHTILTTFSLLLRVLQITVTRTSTKLSFRIQAVHSGTAWNYFSAFIAHFTGSFFSCFFSEGFILPTMLHILLYVCSLALSNGRQKLNSSRSELLWTYDFISGWQGNMNYPER